MVYNSQLVSVLLPVRNGEKYLQEAIESVLNQTYANIELIVVNDGSFDNTLNILKSYNDKRIKYITTEGIGLVEALNLGIKSCKGTYIARMDADDICYTNRLELQVALLNELPDIGVVGSDVNLIDENGNIVGVQKGFNLSNEELMQGLTLKRKMNPIVHPSTMVRSEILTNVSGYRNYLACEDKDLWLRIFSTGNYYRIPEPLLKYRINSEGVSKKMYKQQKVNGMLSILNYEISEQLEIDLYEEESELLKSFTKYFHFRISDIITDFEAHQLFKEKILNKPKYYKLLHLLFSKDVIRILRYNFFNRKETRHIIDEAVIFAVTFIKRRDECNFKMK